MGREKDGAPLLGEEEREGIDEHFLCTVKTINRAKTEEAPGLTAEKIQKKVNLRKTEA